MSPPQKFRGLPGSSSESQGADGFVTSGNSQSAWSGSTSMADGSCSWSWGWGKTPRVEHGTWASQHSCGYELLMYISLAMDLPWLWTLFLKNSAPPKRLLDIICVCICIIMYTYPTGYNGFSGKFHRLKKTSSPAQCRNTNSWQDLRKATCFSLVGRFFQSGVSSWYCIILGDNLLLSGLIYIIFWKKRHVWDDTKQPSEKTLPTGHHKVLEKSPRISFDDFPTRTSTYERCLVLMRFHQPEL